MGSYTVSNLRGVMNQNAGTVNRGAILLSSAALTLFGLKRRSWIGLGLAAIGGTLFYRSLQGQCASQGALVGGSTHSPERPATDVENDKVDEASWESFPASDSPGYYQTTS